MSRIPYEQRTDLEKVHANWKKTTGLFARREYSLSIVRAAVTGELALNYAIRHELHVQRSLPIRFVDNLLKWANGIEGKLQKLLLEITAGTQAELPVQQIARSLRALNKQRNAIAHKGEFRNREPAQEQLTRAHAAVQQLVQLYDSTFALAAFDPSRTNEVSRMVPGGSMVQMSTLLPNDEH